MAILTTWQSTGLGRLGWQARWVAIALMGAALRLPLEAAPAREYQVKAVFLFNFAQFVDWPPASFSGPATPLVIGVLGSDPFGPMLEDVVHGEQVQGHPITIERYRRLQDVGACHVLFVSESERERLPEIRTQLAGRSVLTVGESEGFSMGGGMIRFINEKGHIRLRINVGATQQAGLKLSSKLLRAA